MTIGTAFAAGLWAEDLPGKPDGGEVLARVGMKQLTLAEVRSGVEDAAEKARFERLEKVGRYRFALFETVVLAREAWLDTELLARDLQSGAEVPRAIQKEREQGLDSLTREEFDEREEYLGGLRSKYRCELDVPAFRQTVSRTDAPRMGHPDAPVTITEFIDLRCRACAEMAALLQRVKREFGDAVAIEERHYALTPRGGEAFRLSEAALCAEAQGKYWEFRERALARIGEVGSVDDLQLAIAADLRLSLPRFKACLDEGGMAAHVIRDQEEGAEAGVWGTPTVFVNGRRYLGGGEAKIREIVELELNRERRSEGCP